MTIWAETRIPARITGHAIGSSTWTRVRDRLIPIPRADSMTDGLMLDNPTTALRRMGRVAKKATTITAGATPKPTGAINRPISAKDGMVRPMAETELATEVRTLLRYTRVARTTARAVAKTRHCTTRLKCCQPENRIWLNRFPRKSNTSRPFFSGGGFSDVHSSEPPGPPMSPAGFPGLGLPPTGRRTTASRCTSRFPNAIRPAHRGRTCSSPRPATQHTEASCCGCATAPPADPTLLHVREPAGPLLLHLMPAGSPAPATSLHCPGC